MTDYYVKDGENYVLSQDKLVPERDLMALKASKETGEQQSSTKVAELQGKVDELTARATTAEADLNKVNAEMEPLKVEAAKVPQLTEQVTTLTQKSSAAEGQLLDTRRDGIISKYNITGDNATKVKSMTAEQLASFEENATTLGYTPGQKPPTQPPVVRGDGGRIDTPQSALATIHEGLSELQTARS